MKLFRVQNRSKCQNSGQYSNNNSNLLFSYHCVCCPFLHHHQIPKVVNFFMKSLLIKQDHSPVHSSKILQYYPYQEQRYVSHYSAVQTLKPVITVNPYQQSLVRHDQYFLTLADQEKRIYQVNTDNDNIYHGRDYDDPIYRKDFHEERIYHGVNDPISEI